MNYVKKQIEKAIERNGGTPPPFIDVYNGAPVFDCSTTLATNSNMNFGSCGTILIVEAE